MKEKIADLLKSKNTGKLLFIAGLIGIVLIYASTLLPEKQEKLPSAREESFSEEEYRLSLEENVKQIVNAVCLDGEAVVSVTLDTGITYEYADEQKQNKAEEETKVSKESEQKLIIVKDSSGAETPLLITSHMPSVRGVAIICNASEGQKEEIKKAVTAALDINSRKIYIGTKGG